MAIGSLHKTSRTGWPRAVTRTAPGTGNRIQSRWAGAYALPPTALSNDTNTWPEGLGAPSVPNVLNTAMPGLDSEALFVDVVAGLAVVGKSHHLSDCCGLG